MPTFSKRIGYKPTFSKMEYVAVLLCLEGIDDMLYANM